MYPVTFGASPAAGICSTNPRRGGAAPSARKVWLRRDHESKSRVVAGKFLTPGNSASCNNELLFRVVALGRYLNRVGFDDHIVLIKHGNKPD